MNTRLLGTLSIVGGLAYVVMALSRTIAPVAANEYNFTGLLLSLLWALGAICGWLGFIMIRGTGTNIAVRILSFLPVVGLSLAALSIIYALVTRTDVFALPLASMGLMLELIGSVLNAIFAIATRSLPGWRKFAPLSVPLGVVLGGLISGVASTPVLAIPFCLGIAYALLGYVVQSGEPAPAMIRQPV